MRYEFELWTVKVSKLLGGQYFNILNGVSYWILDIITETLKIIFTPKSVGKNYWKRRSRAEHAKNDPAAYFKDLTAIEEVSCDAVIHFTSTYVPLRTYSKFKLLCGEWRSFFKLSITRWSQTRFKDLTAELTDWFLFNVRWISLKLHYADVSFSSWGVHRIQRVIWSKDWLISEQRVLSEELYLSPAWEATAG